MEKGKRTSLCIVYTGDGKGKTTAAFGLCMRAAGHGKKSLVIQFMKGSGNKYGEAVLAAERIPEIKVVKSGRDCFVSRDKPHPDDIRLAAEGLALAEESVASGQYHIVVLDEINVAIDYGLVPIERVLRLINNRNPATHVVLTGRYARPEIIEAADTVTEMRLVKHHYYNGVPALESVEF
ncbi:MAG: cob(I)yrinic acid a,c-diamide adenosyltransferase [Bacillota bacterium]